MSKKIFLISVLLALPILAQAGWQDYLNDIKKSIKGETTSPTTVAAPLSEETVVSGLKQALNQGVEKSVKQLGSANGFLGDATVKIPMPDTLGKVETGLRKIGQDKVADNFINTMNQAAEKAVPMTTDILVTAVKNMTLKDAINILKGEPDAATQYFKRSSTPQLRSAIKPLVTKATNSVGLTNNYKQMISKAGYLARYVDQDSLDLDQYITDKAIDGLFIKIALEEKNIRENPVARTTELLRSVFGGLIK